MLFVFHGSLGPHQQQEEQDERTAEAPAQEGENSSPTNSLCRSVAVGGELLHAVLIYQTHCPAVGEVGVAAS